MMIPIDTEHLDQAWIAFQEKAEEIYALFPDLSKFDLEVKLFTTKEWGDCLRAHDYDLLDAFERSK